MTRIFKSTVVAGMLAGLMVASLGVAQAEEVSGGRNSYEFEWELPTVVAPHQGFKAPSMTVTLNGQPQTIGGQEASAGGQTLGGGILTVVAEASDWLVSYTKLDCPAGQVGTGVILKGKTASATLEAIYTSFSGESRRLAAPPVDGRNPTGNFGFCG